MFMLHKLVQGTIVSSIMMIAEYYEASVTDDHLPYSL